jgi:hypothetical protein
VLDVSSFFNGDMELNNEYNEFHEEFNSQMAFPSRTTHGDVNGLQPLDTPVDKA